MDLPARYQQIDLALVLGSGLGPLAELLTDQTDLAIPGWKKPSVKGHHGRVVVGLLGTVKTIAIVGRIHYYEGHGVNQTVLPISLFKTLGVSTVILTNASGGLNSSYRPGDLAVIKDHVSFAGLAGVNPLIGNPAMPQGFPAVADAYDYQLRLKACTAAQKLDIAVHESVYCFVAGPSFETRAEARFLRSAGCDLVGMSTVPEVIASVALGMRVSQSQVPSALDALAGKAANAIDPPASHAEVLESSLLAAQKFKSWVLEIVSSLEFLSHTE